MKNINSLFQKCLFCYVLILLCACSFIPDENRPALPVAETYPEKTACLHGCASVRELRWEDFFTDPELKQLIEIALKNNRDLRIALQRIDEAQAQYGIQKAALYPTLNAGASDIRARAPGDILSTAPPGNPPITLSAYTATLSVSSWELDFWGHLRSLNEAALENYLATEEASHATYIMLIQQVANTYLAGRELKGLIDIGQKMVKNHQAYYHLIQRRYEEGVSTKLDLAEAETQLEQAKSDLATFQRQHELNDNALTLLVGTPLSIKKSKFSWNESYFVEEISPGLPSELLQNRPDILAAEHDLKSANANIGAARAAFFPTISLTGSYGTASPELNHLFSSGSKLWTFYPQITVPIFDWEKRASNLDLAQVRKNIAVAEYENTIQVAFREVADALADNTWFKKQVSFQNTALDAQKEYAHLTKKKYQNGTSTYMQVLEAEDNKLSAEQTLLQTRYALLESRINLYTALGGSPFFSNVK